MWHTLIGLGVILACTVGVYYAGITFATLGYYVFAGRKEGSFGEVWTESWKEIGGDRGLAALFCFIGWVGFATLVAVTLGIGQAANAIGKAVW